MGTQPRCPEWGSTKIAQQVAHRPLCRIGRLKKLRKIFVELKQSSSGEVLLQHLSHQMNLEQRRKNLIVEFPSQGQPFVFPFARYLSGCPTQRRILLPNPFSRVDDVLGLTKHFPGKYKGGEKQEQSPYSTDRNCGGEWKGK